MVRCPGPHTVGLRVQPVLYFSCQRTWGVHGESSHSPSITGSHWHPAFSVHQPADPARPYAPITTAGSDNLCFSSFCLFLCNIFWALTDSDFTKKCFDAFLGKIRISFIHQGLKPSENSWICAGFYFSYSEFNWGHHNKGGWSHKWQINPHINPPWSEKHFEHRV